MVKRSDIVTTARTWLGVKWQHQGRTRNGIDCAGLVDIIGEKFEQWDEQPIRDYPTRPDGTYIDHFRKHMVEKRILDAKDGDVFIFAEGTHPCHCGVRSTQYGQPAVVHAHAKRRFVIEETLVSAESVVGQPTHCFAFPDIED